MSTDIKQNQLKMLSKENDVCLADNKDLKKKKKYLLKYKHLGIR
jgi:hypothetical protein